MCIINVPSVLRQKDACDIDSKQNVCMSCRNGLVRNQLRETEERLSELVDVVVDGLHVGFARSIQNYSHILQLFKESKEQVRYQSLPTACWSFVLRCSFSLGIYLILILQCGFSYNVKGFVHTFVTSCWPKRDGHAPAYSALALHCGDNGM